MVSSDMCSFFATKPIDSRNFLPKMRFLDILVVLRRDLGQISFNLVENAFVTRQLALLATKITFYELLAHACADIKILFLDEKVTYVLRLFDF